MEGVSEMTCGRPCGKSLAELELECVVSRIAALYFLLSRTLLFTGPNMDRSKVQAGQLLCITYWRSGMECALLQGAGL